MSETARGRFVWYELLTTRPDEAKPFYTELIGWGTQAWEGGDPPYTMWTNGGTPLGGVMTLPEDAKKAGAPPHWLGYIGTPKVDPTVERAKKLGARLLMGPMDIPTVGRVAVLADPQGAVFAVFSPASDAPGDEGPPKLGEFSWHELATTDYQAGFDFYAELFGWEKKETMDMGEGGIYLMYGRRGVPFPMGGIFNKPKEMPACAWLFYVRVEDVNRAVEKVQRMGGKLLNGPMEVPGGDWIAQCADPQGAAFAVHHTKK